MFSCSQIGLDHTFVDKRKLTKGVGIRNIKMLAAHFLKEVQQEGRKVCALKGTNKHQVTSMGTSLNAKEAGYCISKVFESINWNYGPPKIDQCPIQDGTN